MRILLIHNKYGKFSGEESALESQISVLKSHGNEVFVYTRSSEKLHGLWSKTKAFFSGFHNFRSIAEIKKVIKTTRPEIVHIHNLYPFISPSILPVIRRYRIPIVMTVHNYRLICPNGLFFSHGEICERCSGGKEWNCIIRNCENSMVKSIGYALRNYYARKKKLYTLNVQRFICLTGFQKEKLIENGFNGTKIVVIPNFLISSPQRKFENTQKKYFAFSGRVNKQKGFDVLIKAMVLLNEQDDSDTSLDVQVAGQVDEKFIKQFKMPDRIHFIGELPKEKMDEFYNKAHFLVFTSRSYEGSPMVFLEAMQNRIPIIAPRLGAFPELIKDGFNGLLFTPGDPIDLAEKIELLSSNPELCVRLGANGYQRLINENSSEINYKRVIALCKQVIIETSIEMN